MENYRTQIFKMKKAAFQCVKMLILFKYWYVDKFFSDSFLLNMHVESYLSTSVCRIVGKYFKLKH